MRSLTFSVAAIACLATASAVGAVPIVELGVTPGPAQVDLVLTVTGDAGERPDVTGFYIYRIEFLGEPDCYGAIRVTDEPLLRPAGTASYSFQVADDAISDGRAYRYYVEGYPLITSGTHWSLGFGTERSWSIVTIGSALIADGVKIFDTGGGLWMWLCAGCGAFLEHIGTAPSEIVGDDAWRLYGRVQPSAEWYRYEWVIESAEPAICRDFAVTPATWGTVKGLYR